MATKKKVQKTPPVKSKVALSRVSKTTPARPAKAEAPAAPGTLAAGARAPAFKLTDQSGDFVSSAELKGKPYVLYFYPKDDTPGCTKEACGFRDADATFRKRGVRVLGVSPDAVARHQGFAKKYSLPFSLLADTEKDIARAYGVWAKKQNYGREYMGIVRSTFLVDGKGVVRKVWRGVKVPGHVEAVLDELGAL